MTAGLAACGSDSVTGEQVTVTEASTVSAAAHRSVTMNLTGVVPGGNGPDGAKAKVSASPSGSKDPLSRPIAGTDA
jgi:hypothetical protein